jgi:hypothetical protein
MTEHHEPPYAQLEKIGLGFGWASKILISSFGQTGLTARQNKDGASFYTVASIIKSELNLIELKRFKRILQEIIGSPEALEIITSIVNTAHAGYGIDPMDPQVLVGHLKRIPETIQATTFINIIHKIVDFLKEE